MKKKAFHAFSFFLPKEGRRGVREETEEGKGRAQRESFKVVIAPISICSSFLSRLLFISSMLLLVMRMKQTLASRPSKPAISLAEAKQKRSRGGC